MYITEIILEKNLYYIFRDYIARKLTDKENINKRKIIWIYLLGFNKDWTKVEHIWKISNDFTNLESMNIGIYNNYIYNVENMRKYEITDKYITRE